MVKTCPICGKVFSALPDNLYTVPPSPKTRLVMHMLHAHQEQITVYIKPDKNNIEAWIINVDITEYRLLYPSRREQ